LGRQGVAPLPCQSCDTILSALLDPNALKTDIMGEEFNAMKKTKKWQTESQPFQRRKQAK